jgi:ectoine hydroxylase-related dioxygenase (phytanoyl-CoA dioxygenase family)
MTDRGYSISPHGLSGAECDELVSALATGAAARTRAGTRHLMAHSLVTRLASDSRLLALAREWLGPGAVAHRATLFDKSADRNWLVPWHQDTALPLRARFDESGWGPWSEKGGILYAHAPTWALSRIVALRVHLDPSTEENGSLHVIPGSNAAGVLSDQDVSKYAATSPHVQCVVPRGGVLTMSPLLIHCSSKGRNGEPRRVLHIEYCGSLRLGPGIELAIA